jgi:CRISPR-associated endonuclease/helicase Cas3
MGETAMIVSRDPETEDTMAIAHRRPEGGTLHGLRDHLTATAERAAAFAEAWGATEAARLCGLWHDLGKYAVEFQEMIRNVDADAHVETAPYDGRRRIDHSSAGAQHAVERFGRFGRLLAYAIAGHHAGLPDWIGEGGRTGLKDRLDDRGHFRRAASVNPPSDILDAPAPNSGLPRGADPSLWVRMLASALFDADFLDTENFFASDKGQARTGWQPIPDLLERLDGHLHRFDDVPPSRVNEVRREVLTACRVAADRPPGLYSLTVPTGGGKTFASLAFALRHARKHGLSRVIYAVPFTSIIEQTAGEFRKALGDSGDAVLEHHSAMEPVPERETARSRLAAENWDAPIVVTTTVQLFESLFANRASRVRKLHNIARSVIVIDEAQALPPAVLRPIVAAIDQLVRHYGVTVVLCTATQPALGAVFKELCTPTEIMPSPSVLFEQLDRVTIELPIHGIHRKWEEISAWMMAADQGLTIVNTRRDAFTLHSLLPKGAVHLSTFQCPAHRSLLLEDAKSRLRRGESVRVVSTSLIEAGVDIDFPIVLRAMAGLDSLAQAAGRCNREGRLDKGRFVVFRPEGARPVKAIAQAIEAAESALAECATAPFRPEAFTHFFHELFWARGELDDYGMAGLLGLGRQTPRFEGDPFDFRYRTAAERFRMIDDAQESVVVPYDRKADDTIKTLRILGPSRERLRVLQRYVIPVPRRIVERMLAEGALRDEGVLILRASAKLYDEDTGLARWCFSKPFDGDVIF